MATEKDNNKGAEAAAPAAPWEKGAGKAPETTAAGSSVDGVQASPVPEVKAPETAPKTHETLLQKVEEEVKKAEGELVEMVTVTIPKAFNLRITNEQVFSFRAGTQQMERAHAEHWYSKANGVEIYDPKAQEKEGK